jgi:hypothetical protein
VLAEMRLSMMMRKMRRRESVERRAAEKSRRSLEVRRSGESLTGRVGSSRRAAREWMAFM